MRSYFFKVFLYGCDKGLGTYLKKKTMLESMYFLFVLNCHSETIDFQRRQKVEAFAVCQFDEIHFRLKKKQCDQIGSH